MVIVLVFLLLLSPDVYAEYEIVGESVYNNTLSDMTNGTFLINPINIINWIKDLVFSEISVCKSLLVSVIIVGAISAVCENLKSSFLKKSAGDAAFYACFCIVCSVCVRYFGIALGYSKEVVSLMNIFINKLAPVISSLLILSGKVASASAFHPVLLTAVYVVSIIVEHWLMPLIAYGTVLSVVNNMSGSVSITGIVRLINSITKWILAAAFTLFSGICGIYGFSAAAFDSLSAKTMKFAVGSLVPVVGGFLSETLDTVVSSGAMMKNVVGSAGIVAVCVMCSVPVVKLGVMILMMKLAAAIIEPVSDKRITKLLWDISSAVTLLFAVVITIAILFIICISIIIASTG